MDITRGNMDALFTGFKTALKQGLDMKSLPMDKLAMVVTSTTAMEKYPFMVLLSTMREWIGDRQVQNLKDEVLQVTNRDFEHTIGVKRNNIEDDTLGLYTPLFQQMGVDANNLWPKLAVAALIANGKWIDGSAFFLTNRKFGKNTICNKTTDALSHDSYGAARLTMMSYVGYSGDPLAIVPDTLIVGPKLESMGKKILENKTIVKSYAGDTDDATVLNHAPTENEYFGTAELEVNPLLVGDADDYWFLAQTKGVVKPVIVQKRKVGALIRYDSEHDECVKKNNQNEYGLHYRGAAALTLPPLCYGGIVA